MGRQRCQHHAAPTPSAPSIKFVRVTGCGACANSQPHTSHATMVQLAGSRAHKQQEHRASIETTGDTVHGEHAAVPWPCGVIGG